MRAPNLKNYCNGEWKRFLNEWVFLPLSISPLIRNRLNSMNLSITALDLKIIEIAKKKRLLDNRGVRTLASEEIRTLTWRLRPLGQIAKYVVCWFCQFAAWKEALFGKILTFLDNLQTLKLIILNFYWILYTINTQSFIKSNLKNEDPTKIWRFRRVCKFSKL